MKNSLLNRNKNIDFKTDNLDFETKGNALSVLNMEKKEGNQKRVDEK